MYVASPAAHNKYISQYLGQLPLAVAVVQTLKAPELAGLACAMVSPEAVSKPQISAAYEPSEAVVAAVRALEDARSALFDLQAAAGVHVPLAVDLRLAGVSLLLRV